MTRFVPDTPPVGMPQEHAEWIMRQLRRITGSGQVADEATDDNTQRIVALEQHPPRTDNPHQTSWANLLGKPSCPMNWRGAYVPGQISEACDVATQSGWAMVANKQTDDRPAPQKVGQAEWVTDRLGGVVWDTEQNANTSVLYVGARYRVVNDGFAYRVRYWIPDDVIDHKIEIWMVNDPLGIPDPHVIVPEFIVGPEDVEGWREYPIGNTFVLANTVHDLVMIVRGVTGESSFSGVWDYKRKNGSPSASDGEIWHQSGGGGREMRVSNEDDDGTNRRTELELMKPGDEISGGGINWTIISTDYTNGGHVRYEVQPASRASENKYTFQFTYFGAAPIQYDIDQNFYQGIAEVSGLYSETSYPDAVENDNAYGVDLLVQPAQVSPDWDFLSYSR